MTRPTNVRRTVLAFAFAAAFITYLDRVCISAAAPSMTAELGLTATEMGWVFSVFAVAYGIFEIPMGWMGDRFGQRKLLTRIVLSWSAFTMLTGAVRSLGPLLGVRFVFGAAEAGAFPTMARALARWFPTTERGWTTGWMWAGARLGGSLAPPLAAWFVVSVGWREAFWAFGSIGLLWCVLFWSWYRDDPAEHPRVNEAELALIHSGRAPAAGHRRAHPVEPSVHEQEPMGVVRHVLLLGVRLFLFRHVASDVSDG
ncbi:MAG: MFS transporter [Bryobacterales bacterium]